MSRRERLRARQLPTETVILAASGGGDPEELLLRALLPERWDELVAAHPPTEQGQAAGAAWDLATFRPALIAASVVPPDGEEPLSAADWAELAVGGQLTAGDWMWLFNVAVGLNDRSPQDSVGKG